MNWENIKTKYPKAFDKYSEWLEDPTEITEYGFLVYIEMNDKHTIVNDRYLYDFFDEQGINISIGAFLGFDYRIYQKANTLASNKITFDTRTLAEEKAFEKAFEILENKLGL